MKGGAAHWHEPIGTKNFAIRFFGVHESIHEVLVVFESSWIFIPKLHSLCHCGDSESEEEVNALKR